MTLICEPRINDLQKIGTLGTLFSSITLYLINLFSFLKNKKSEKKCAYCATDHLSH
jgi:hypothetical protein